MERDFASSALAFVDRIESLRVSLPFSATVMTAVADVAQNELLDYFRENAVDIVEDGDSIQGKIPAKNTTQFNRRVERHKRLSISQEIVPRSFVVSLICEYDAFFGDVVRLTRISHTF